MRSVSLVPGLCRAIVVIALSASPALAQAPQAGAIQEKEVVLFGQRINYLESGASGPVVILLHGLGANASHWRLTMPALTGHHVYAPDQIGAGKSAKPSLNYRVGTLVDFLHEFYLRLGIEKATLVGSSQGGWVALAYALAHPERVERIVLVNAAGYSPGRFGGPAPTRDGLERLNPSTLAGMRSLLLLLFANKLLVNDVTVRAAYEQKLAADDGHVVSAFIESVLRGEDYIDGRLEKLTVPTQVIWGRDDALLPLAIGETFAREIPGAALAVLDNCGHVPQLECFLPFNAALMKFLAGR
jgi:pimeloyl-ACP methyl ester carboxylesterase